MKKRGKYNFNFNFSFSQRALYTLIAILIVLIVGVGVYAYGTNNPSVFGHSAGEVEGTVPSGAIMFFDGMTSCPTGWELASDANGRYIVGRTDGTIGANSKVGDDLNDKEERAVGQHLHSVDPPVTTTSEGTGDQMQYLGSGGNAGINPTATSTKRNVEHTHNVNIAPFNSANAGSVAGTNAPYIQYLVC